MILVDLESPGWIDVVSRKSYGGAGGVAKAAVIADRVGYLFTNARTKKVRRLIYKLLPPWYNLTKRASAGAAGNISGWLGSLFEIAVG